MPQNQLAKLIQGAQRRNAEAGLTGILIFMQGRFLQVLEGPQMALSQCYRRIEQDKRHCDITLLQSARIQQRAFPQWRMGLFFPDQLPHRAREAALSIDALVPMNSPDRGDDPQVRAIVRDFLSSFKRLAAV